MTLGRRRVVRVPASSANLGPGFDVLGEEDAPPPATVTTRAELIAALS